MVSGGEWRPAAWRTSTTANDARWDDGHWSCFTTWTGTADQTAWGSDNDFL